MPESQNAEDLEHKHYAYFLTQEWISYAVLTPDGSDVIQQSTSHRNVAALTAL